MHLRRGKRPPCRPHPRLARPIYACYITLVDIRPSHAGSGEARDSLTTTYVSRAFDHSDLAGPAMLTKEKVATCFRPFEPGRIPPVIHGHQAQRSSA